MNLKIITAVAVGVLAIAGIGYLAVGSEDSTTTDTVTASERAADSARAEQEALDQSTEVISQPAEGEPEATQQEPSTGGASTAPTEAINEPAEGEPESTEQTSSAPGTYALYTDSSIASTSNQKVLFFHASWCPQCIKLENDIKAQGVPSGVSIFEVDFDDRQDLRAKYGVTQQTTTILVDDNGNLVRTYGAYSNPTLAAVISNLGL